MPSWSTWANVRVEHFVWPSDNNSDFHTARQDSGFPATIVRRKTIPFPVSWVCIVSDLCAACTSAPYTLLYSEAHNPLTPV